jgi:hypothetical protein
MQLVQVVPQAVSTEAKGEPQHLLEQQAQLVVTVDEEPQQTQVTLARLLGLQTMVALVVAQVLHLVVQVVLVGLNLSTGYRR